MLPTLDMLKKRSAKSDVQHLVTAADREHRYVSPQSSFQTRKLHGIALRMSLTDFRVSLCAVPSRIHVDAAREHQCVNAGHSFGYDVGDLLIEIKHLAAGLSHPRPIPVDGFSGHVLPPCD